MKIFVLLATIFAVSLASDQYVHFYGYQVIRVFPSTLEQYDAIHTLQQQGHLDFWSDIRKNDATDIMVGPHQMKAFKAHLARFDIKNEVLIADVEKNIVAEREEQAKSKASGMNWTAYHRISVIHEWLEELRAEYPNLVTLQNLGTSNNGNALPLAKVSTGGSGKQAIWIDGNIHAREWISPATVTYILNQLVTNSNTYADLLNRFDFYFVCSINPDGYEFSHTTNRMWRKTRKNHDSPLGCIGTDANRNWGFMWGQPGASNDKCSDTYRGPSAFSEPENDLARAFIQSTNVDWLVFITVHSYGQYALLPYGDGSRPSDYSDLLAKANTFASALQAVNGIRYSVGNSEDLLYTTSGTSQDWAKGSGPFKYSYTFELRDTGSYGFQLPAAQIIPTGTETLAGIVAMLRSI